MIRWTVVEMASLRIRYVCAKLLASKIEASFRPNLTTQAFLVRSHYFMTGMHQYDDESTV